MGLFDIFKKKDAYADTVRKIAAIISCGSKDVAKEMSECIANPKKYAAKHPHQFAARGIDTESASERSIIWIAMTDCLMAYSYAQEFDWKCDKDEFIGIMSSLTRFTQLGCEINPVLLYDDDDISAWCAAQDKVWYTKGVCIGGIDIDSDSYVLFVCTRDELAMLKELSRSIHRRIVCGCEL